MTLTSSLRLIAHRGVPATHVENTLPSFCEAARLGLKEVELDVRLSSCQTPVVIHDHSLRRTHGLRDVVSDTTAVRLKELGIPSLSDVLVELAKNDVHATVEIKVCSLATFPLVVDLCRAGRHAISSFDPKWIRAALKISSDIPVQWTVGAFDAIRPIRVPSVVLKGQVREVAVDIDRLTAAGVARARALGLTILAYTVRTPAQAKKAVSLGIDGIFVDDPAAVRDWLAAINDV